MDNPQDCLVTSSQDVISKPSPSTSSHSATVYQNRNGRKKKIKSGSEQFPWFLSFQNLCRSVIGSNSMKDLLNVITVYTEHISRDVEASYSKPNRAAKVKTNIISMLGFFHNCYITMKEPFDEATYLEKMSNLLTLYFDMEVKASRRGKESVKRITSKLISALFIILNNSAEYILDTILKARFTVKSYSEICIPIFKTVTNLPQSQEMNYVRCLLVFKLWKKMLPCREERNSINRLATSKLSPPPAQVMEFIKRGLLTNVLPNLPEDNKKASLVTRFYMTKKFNLREAIKAFFKMEAEMKLNDFTSAIDSIKFIEEVEDSVAVENSFEKDYSLLESIWKDISNSPKSPEHSTPSTSGNSPLDVGFGGSTCPLELSKSVPRKVKKSLFKCNALKKNKQTKINSKGKLKKIQEDLVIDLSDDYEDNFPEITLDVSENVKSSLQSKEVCNNISPSKTAVDFVDNEIESASFLSESISEVNSSEDLKLCSEPIKKDLKDVKTSTNPDSKSLVNKQVKSENNFVSECLSSASKSLVDNFPTPSIEVREVRDFSPKILLGKDHRFEKDKAPENVKTSCQLNEKPVDKVVIHEKNNHQSKNKPITESIKTKETAQKIIENVKSNLGKELNSSCAQLSVEESPANKIVLSCKNFSKIGFKHNEEIEMLEQIQMTNENPLELVSKIEIDEDPILKAESVQEDPFLLKHEEIPSLIEQGLNDEDIGWDNGLEVVTQVNPRKEPTANEVAIFSEDINSKACQLDVSALNSNFNLDAEIHQNSNCDGVGDIFQDKTVDSKKKEPLRRLAVFNFEDDSSNEFCGQMYHMPSYFQELDNDKHNNNSTLMNKTVNISESDCQDIVSKVNPVKSKDKLAQTLKSQNSTLSETDVISDITGVDLKSGTKMVHKSISTIIQELKENSASSDSSNQESSEVSSSSFEDNNYQMRSCNISNFKINPLVEKQDPKLCKVEKPHFNEFSSCMQTPSNKISEKSLFIEKRDKNTEVPCDSYNINKSAVDGSSQSTAAPKNDDQNQTFNLHKGLNTCLLHKILGEEDCLKSGCLLKNSVVNKNPQYLDKGGFHDVSLKQELENSSELPSENSPPTIPSLWNPSVGVKVEKDTENIRGSECIEGLRNTSSEFLIRSVTEACNFKEIDYNIGANDCDNLNNSYESDGDDRNLVIDEDIDFVKDHNETSDSPLKSKADCVRNDDSKCIVGSIILTNNNNMEPKIWNNNVPCTIINVTRDARKQDPGKNNVPIKEGETLKKEIAGKHKLPRIVESNIKTSHRNKYVSEEPRIRFRSFSNSELLTAEITAPYISSQNYGKDVPKYCTQSKTIKRCNESGKIGQISSSSRTTPPYTLPQHVGNPNSIRKNRDPRLGPVDNSYRLKPDVNVHSNLNSQPSQMKPLENRGMNQTVSSPEIIQANSPRLVPSPSRYETYTKYNSANKMCVPSNRGNNSPVDRYCQTNTTRSDKYRSLEKISKNRESAVSKFQENTNSVSHANHPSFIEGSNLNDNSNSSYHKYNTAEPQKVNAGEPLYNINSARDALCLVKSKDDPKESYDFEFNVCSSIAQEVEVCSGSENLGGEWLYPITSEIGHPDWPIANEQNVIDSSSYSQTPEQFMYSLLKSDEGSAMTDMEQTCYIPLELQQIDNRHPNIVGKNVNKEELNLHLRTLERDNNICCSQSEFKEFYLSQDLPPTIPVPFPPQGRVDSLNSSVRCPCEQCSDNHQKLVSNYNILTHIRNSKIKPMGVYKTEEAFYSERDPNGEFDSSLPLKKRKTLTNSKSTDELVLPSYPNTPMISIAQLELTGYEQSNQVIVPNPQSQWREALTYNPINLVQPPFVEPFENQAKGKRKASKRRKTTR